ncbi:J domain-containing protein [Pseudanabaenaceae cyanobacterium LEGE 13415]|nr:J domain-containing protein [Pseudanabaenaceae cyanobacterium LEGE 13415]
MLDANKCYAILELKPGASREEIKRSHKDLVQVWHPDRFEYNSQLQQKAQKRLKEINAAHDFLMQHGQPPTDQAHHSQQNSSIQKHDQEAKNTSTNNSQQLDSETLGCLNYMAFFIIAIAVVLLIKFPVPTIMVLGCIIFALSQTLSKQ